MWYFSENKGAINTLTVKKGKHFVETDQVVDVLDFPRGLFYFKGDINAEWKNFSEVKQNMPFSFHIVITFIR